MRITRLSVAVVVFLLLPGCVTRKFQTNTTASNISVSSVPNLIVTQPVSLKNSSPQSGDAVIAEYFGWEVYGDLHKFTESAVGATKNALERQNATISDTADKVLELSVRGVELEEGAVTFRVTTTLSVRTGDAVTKEYVATRRHGNVYGTTPTIETTLGLCIEKMLNDDAIVQYLAR